MMNKEQQATVVTSDESSPPQLPAIPLALLEQVSGGSLPYHGFSVPGGTASLSSEEPGDLPYHGF